MIANCMLAWSEIASLSLSYKIVDRKLISRLLLKKKRSLVSIFRSSLGRVTILFSEETRRMWLFYTHGDRLVGNSRTEHNGKQRSLEKERRVRNNA